MHSYFLQRVKDAFSSMLAGRDLETLKFHIFISYMQEFVASHHLFITSLKRFDNQHLLCFFFCFFLHIKTDTFQRFPSFARTPQNLTIINDDGFSDNFIKLPSYQ